MTSVWLLIKTPHVLFTVMMSNIINVYIINKILTGWRRRMDIIKKGETLKYVDQEDLINYNS